MLSVVVLVVWPKSLLCNLDILNFSGGFPFLFFFVCLFSLFCSNGGDWYRRSDFLFFISGISSVLTLLI